MMDSSDSMIGLNQYSDYQWPFISSSRVDDHCYVIIKQYELIFTVILTLSSVS